MDIPSIFEDKELLVIDKPYGVVVNRADTTSGIETIQDFAETKISDLELRSKEAKSEIEEEFLSRGGIVHRLDKDTSGVLVIAKTPLAFENLKNQFKERKTTKKYLALVHGKVEPASGKVNVPIERSPFNRMHFGVFPGGREAETFYRTVKHIEMSGENKGQNTLTLLEVEPKTGRTHQIRVHMKYLGHPIVSDPIYGGRKQLKTDLEFCSRLFLHAKELTIFHPKTDKKMKFEAKVPGDLLQLVEI